MVITITHGREIMASMFRYDILYAFHLLINILFLQIGNAVSSLRIIDYAHGFTGAVHDSNAFRHTCAFMHPQWLFEGEEFAWANSAYTPSNRIVPVYKEPLSERWPGNIFNQTVS